MAPIKVDILVLEGGGPSSLGLTLDALDTANRVAGAVGAPLFSWRVLCHQRNQVALRHGLSIDACPLSVASSGDLAIVVGIGAATAEAIDDRLARSDARAAAAWLRMAAAAGAGLAGACTGAFLLGDAGVLDGRACTTSWWLARVLARRRPLARVGVDAMVVEDGPVVTAGAMIGQLDLMLTLIRRLAGPDLARATGNRLAASVRGSQAPYIVPGALTNDPDPITASVEAVVVERLAERVGVADVALALGLTERTLARRILAATGLSSGRFIQKVRLDAAVRLIAETPLPLDVIAGRVGLADAAVLHRLVVRHTGQSPGRFRSARAPG